jgi:magnesium chelatase family protein
VVILAISNVVVQIMRYWLMVKKISGPILDRIDTQKYVGAVDFFNDDRPGKSSSELRLDIERARSIQFDRFKKIPTITHNS